MKDVVCKEFRYKDIIPYQLKIVSMGKIDFFVPTTFKCMDNEYVRLCYCLSDMDPLVNDVDGSEGPYIATSIMNGMMEAIMLRRKLVYLCRDKNYRIAFVPDQFCEIHINDPAKAIRKMTLSLLREIYNVNSKDRHVTDSRVNNPVIVDELIRILSDNSVGMDNCMRRIDTLKERRVMPVNDNIGKTKLGNAFGKIGILDLSRKII